VAVSTDQAFSKQQLIDFAMSHGFSKTFAVRVFNHFLRAANELGLAVEYPCLHRRRPDGESREEVHEPVIGVASFETLGPEGADGVRWFSPAAEDTWRLIRGYQVHLAA